MHIQGSTCIAVLEFIGFRPSFYAAMIGYFLSIYFQSQEVTYAELTMPRNKGYAPMRQIHQNGGGGNAGSCNSPILKINQLGGVAEFQQHNNNANNNLLVNENFASPLPAGKKNRLFHLFLVF